MQLVNVCLYYEKQFSADFYQITDSFLKTLFFNVLIFDFSKVLRVCLQTLVV